MRKCNIGTRKDEECTLTTTYGKATLANNGIAVQGNKAVKSLYCSVHQQWTYVFSTSTTYRFDDGEEFIVNN